MFAAKKAAAAVGGMTARACDGCLRKRACWYCVADDAFLCQGCDSSVHSANQLASRHERIRLEGTAPKAIGSAIAENSPLAWHHGFTRKARTPRHAKPAFLVQPPKEEEEDKITNPLPLVPEIGSDEASPDEDKEQLLYRVPVFDPFAAELCDASDEMENTLAADHKTPETAMGGGLDVLFTDNGRDEAWDQVGNLHGFLPLESDMDLAEFAADVESILGNGLDDDSCGMEGLGLVDCREDEMDKCSENRKVKVEDEDVEAAVAYQFYPALDIESETIDWNFDYEPPATHKEEKVAAAMETTAVNGGCKAEVKRKILLRLNYEGVITAWASQGSPWTTGSRPEINPDDDGWPDFTGCCAAGYCHPCGGEGSHGRGGDGGREARVSRYREKRRTRLFSKKIRYEVRKLNAEKRPRMKGRFVKRSPFAGPAFPYLMNNK